jgi:dTDP-4-amino-4,6-dideoxygalactose transaminase
MGYNWRMSEIHAAIGLSQFTRLNEFIEKRRNIAKVFDKGLKEVEHLSLLDIPSDVKSNYYKYVAFLEANIDRSAFKKQFRDKYDIGLSGEVYELPCHLQPIFKEMHSSTDKGYPVAEDLCKRQICLPIFPTMTEEEANYVVNSLKEALN